jgi:ER-bound oxygenase mpaB/B'/Rubber oxygenase, catalytic domain
MDHDRFPAPGPAATRAQIRTLDPKRDHQRIMFVSCCYAFPFDTTRALEFALFRSFVVPSIGVLLDRTREFGRRTQKRYDDTDLIISEIIEHGYDSERGSRAIARMNVLHGRFKISNADFLYVLSTFVFEPIRWNHRFGWRQLCEGERLALFYFWREVGQRMQIRDIPEEYSEFEEYNRSYEPHFRNNAASERVAYATIQMFAGWAPRPFQGCVLPLMRALMDDSLVAALRLPAAPRLLKQLLRLGLRLRGRISRQLRRSPVLRTEMKHRSYPVGYEIEGLGPTA